MTTDTEALRAQFEAWFSGGFPRSVERNVDGEYKYMPANSAWQTYQAGHAAAKAETAAAVAGRWYFVTNAGAATLCVDEADARGSAAEADIAFPRMAPHLVTQLVPADQLADAVAKERERASVLYDMLLNRPALNAGLESEYAAWTSKCYQVTGAYKDAIRAGAKEPSDG